MSLKDKIKKIINVIENTNIEEIEISSFWGAQKIRLSKKTSVNQTNTLINSNPSNFGPKTLKSEIFWYFTYSPMEHHKVLFHCTQASQVCKRLLEKGIVVRDRSNLMGLEDCIRVTVGTAAENDLFLNELQELL